MTEVTEDIEAVVADSELPPRLRTQVLETVADRDAVTVEDVEDIVAAVEAQYRDTRVDPLDPVGTVSAQSIGEPGTQMSIPGEERILVRRDGETDVVPIGDLVDAVMADREVRTIKDHEVALAPDDLEVLSLDTDEQVTWKPVEEVSRHDAPSELLEFTLESGRTITATKAHSFVTREDNAVVPIAGRDLSEGDWLPTVGAFDQESGRADIQGIEAIGPNTATDGGTAARQIPNFGTALETAAKSVGLESGSVAEATERQAIAHEELASLVEDIRSQGEGPVPRLAALDQALAADVTWEQITGIETVSPPEEGVYDVSVAGLETFTTAAGVVTHNTMNTFHYAGVAEIDVTQGLPRLIELVDARKTPDTPMMTVHLEDEYATDRERAHEVVWSIEATKILALGDISTNVADMVVQIDLNEDTLQERWPTVDDTDEIAGEIAEQIQSALGVETRRDGTVVQFGPEEPSYRDLLQLVEELRDIVFKGIEEVTRVVIRKESGDDGEEEFVLYTEGSAFGDVLDIEGVDASRTTCNNIHEIQKTLGIEAAREAIIDETMDTLEEQGLGDVNVRHLMLVADIMTNTGDIQSIGRHGISGSKESVLARAAFEVTVSHLIDAAVYGEVDDLNGVTENVIVGKPIKLGTGDVNLRMQATGNREQSQSD
ncbi:MAG: DNA-directed RNA polymerase subunit A'' [Halobacteriaceae archaeon]